MDQDLNPKVNYVVIDNKMQAFSMNLESFCQKNQICVLKGLQPVLNMNLEVFSTESIQKLHPRKRVDVRVQRWQLNYENKKGGKRVWPFDSKQEEKETLIKSYALYQGSCLMTFLEKEQAAGQQDLNNEIRFATNFDLSDREQWAEQLRQLDKLPPLFQVDSKRHSMLSHVNKVLGMNTIQLYIKVPGSRTPAHQENNNFCSVNINMGPGNCTWFAVEKKYWKWVNILCNQNHVKFLSGSWWPNVEDLKKAGIPVYVFEQQRGDLVWVNHGCIHWVQAIDFCNNVAWNVGPFTSRQYQIAMERYEWNKEQKFESLVPMVNLSWRLAMNAVITDVKLHSLIKRQLEKSVQDCTQMLDLARTLGVTVKERNEKLGKCQSHRCVERKCAVEIFNVVIKMTREPGTFCLMCARKRAGAKLRGCFMVQQFSLESLKTVCNEFKTSGPTQVGNWLPLPAALPAVKR